MIRFTTAAIEKFVQFCREDGYSGTQYLRAKLLGGGCSGFKYDLQFDERGPSDVDQLIDIATVKSDEFHLIIVGIVDPVSAQYLENCTVDYVTTFMSEGFKFLNPEVVATCGCGSSVAF